MEDAARVEMVAKLDRAHPAQRGLFERRAAELDRMVVDLPGVQELWTHFDGYQLTREFELQALVGGDVRYGGADDLCSVGRGYVTCSEGDA